MSEPRLDDLPGFRRRFVVDPTPGRVRADVEDDYHCMGVTVDHAGGVAIRVKAGMTRVPWTTCPGAPAVVERTFTGAPLNSFAARGDKLLNCTHLYDLALLAAAHAADETRLTYDLLVSDPLDGHQHAELRRDGEAMLRWTLEGWRIRAPQAIAGTTIDKLRPWIETLDPAGREQARLLRWGIMLAHGRAMSAGARSDKVRLPVGQCYTFQPGNAPVAKYLEGSVRDFSGADRPFTQRDPAERRRPKGQSTIEEAAQPRRRSDQ